jgi:hypothetical protein
VLFDRVSNPADAKPDKVDFLKRRLNLIAKRTGLIKPENYGSRVTVRWGDLKGNEYAVEVADRTYKDDNGSDKTVSGIKIDGLYQLTDERVPAALRTVVEAAVEAPQKGTAAVSEPTTANVVAAAGKKKFDMDDL